ncbi:hypothetical protein [Streptomyces sp. NPDC059009]|uniref:hypothetical protein n=1 Tax=Streptomyces sp. NPDC059009 TaxID=3346694 RepID=UPI003682FA6B
MGSEDHPQIAALAPRSDQAGCFGIGPAQKSTEAVASRTDDLAAWVGEQTGQAGFVDFNGDGVEDIAIGDPYNTVSGHKQAGSVSVVYGGGKGSAQIDQSLSFGSPGEDLEGISNTGAVQTYSAIGKPGDGDRWIEIGSNGIPGPKKTNQYLGTTLTATPTSLYIGTPFGPAAKGAVHSIPWTTLTGGPQQPTTVFQPGKDGIPNEGSRFGTSVQ